MLKVKIIFGAILFTAVTLTSCGGGSMDNKAATKIEVTKTVDTLKVNDAIKTETEKTEPANVSCSIFFKGDDYTDEETGVTAKGSVLEHDEFKKNNTCTFCYDSETFHHLTLNGTGKQLTFIVNADEKQLFKKENFDLVDEFMFTKKDFFMDYGIKYSIVIKQNETIIFNGKIDSQQCM